MESLYLSNAIQTPPDTPQDTAAGFPTDGSSTGGVQATVPGAQWYHAVTMEIVNAIRAANVTPSRNDLTQLARAIRKIAGNGIPAGAIQFYAQSSAPEGWLVCDGRAVSREEYSALFTAIGELYGAGNGSTTFNLPNLVGRFAEGATSSVGQSVAAGLPDIQGRFSGLENAEPGRSTFTGAFASTGATGNGPNGFNTDDHIVEFKASRYNAIYGRSNTVQPASVRLLPCIKF